MKAKLVKPQNLKGFQDQLPEDMLVRRRVIETIQKSYELFGFLPLGPSRMAVSLSDIGYQKMTANKVGNVDDDHPQ